MTDQLPHDVDAERAVLGGILIDGNAVFPVGQILKPDDFYDQRHKWIFESMLSLRESGTAIDFVTVTNALESKGHLREVGGAAYLTELINDTPTAVHTEHYALIVKRKAGQRQLINLGAEITKMAWNGDDIDSQELIDWVKRKIEDVKDRYKSVEVPGSTWADLNNLIGPIEWSWPKWLPQGFLTIVVGEQETGKSILMLRLTASMVREDEWPDGSAFEGEPMKVLWVEAEASQAMNLQRAKSWGLPLGSIVHPLNDPLEDVQLDNNRHRAAITALAQRPDVGLVIIDSLSGGHREDEQSAKGMIPIVKWMAELARDTGKVVVLTHHVRKRGLLDSSDGVTLDRVRGSSGITQLARMVWAIDTPDPNDPERRRLSVIKSNLALKPKPLGFRVTDEGLVFGSAPEPPRQETQLDQAGELLQEILADGPVLATEVRAEAEGEEISWSTMKRAKQALGVESRKRNGRWYWELPAKETA